MIGSMQNRVKQSIRNFAWQMKRKRLWMLYLRIIIDVRKILVSQGSRWLRNSARTKLMFDVRRDPMNLLGLKPAKEG
jgi:hypothetical protein